MLFFIHCAIDINAISGICYLIHLDFRRMTVSVCRVMSKNMRYAYMAKHSSLNIKIFLLYSKDLFLKDIYSAVKCFTTYSMVYVYSSPIFYTCMCLSFSQKLFRFASIQKVDLFLNIISKMFDEKKKRAVGKPTPIRNWDDDAMQWSAPLRRHRETTSKSEKHT